MTNSFRPQAQPVDTFVRPSTVAPTTGFDQLVNALKTVNPSINQYFDSRIKDKIKKEQAIGVNLQVEKILNDGTFGKLTSKIRKKDGDGPADMRQKQIDEIKKSKTLPVFFTELKTSSLSQGIRVFKSMISIESFLNDFIESKAQ